MQINNETPLIDKAFFLYAEAGGPLLNHSAIAKEMKVSREWVRKFLCGEIPNPGVLNVESFIRVVKKLSADA